MSIWPSGIATPPVLSRPSEATTGLPAATGRDSSPPVRHAVPEVHRAGECGCRIISRARSISRAIVPSQRTRPVIVVPPASSPPTAQPISIPENPRFPVEETTSLDSRFPSAHPHTTLPDSATVAEKRRKEHRRGRRPRRNHRTTPSYFGPTRTRCFLCPEYRRSIPARYNLEPAPVSPAGARAHTLTRDGHPRHHEARRPSTLPPCGHSAHSRKSDRCLPHHDRERGTRSAHTAAPTGARRTRMNRTRAHSLRRCEPRRSSSNRCRILRMWP